MWPLRLQWRQRARPHEGRTFDLLAAAGAPFGLGSDIGGSIRIPAAFCGIFGHKPTGGLVSNAGQFPTQCNAMMATGPLCRYADDLLPLLCLLVAHFIVSFFLRWGKAPMRNDFTGSPLPS